jgi:hypothetical protein
MIIRADFEYNPKTKESPVTSSIKGKTIAIILIENRGKSE